MRNVLKAAVVAVVMLAAVFGSVLVANAVGNCSSGHYCAWRDSGFVPDPALVNSQAGAGSNHVSVPRDLISSAKNRQSNWWCGYNEHSFVPDELVLQHAPLTNLSYVGGQANDKIDHYDVRSRGC